MHPRFQRLSRKRKGEFKMKYILIDYMLRSTGLNKIYHLKSQLLGVSVLTQWKQTQLVSMRRTWVQSLALLSGLRIRHCCDCGIGQQLQLWFDP